MGDFSRATSLVSLASDFFTDLARVLSRSGSVRCEDNAGAGRVWDRGDASTGLTLWTGRRGAGQRARAAAHLVEAVRDGEEGADEKEPRHPEARRWLANFGVHALRRRKQTNKQVRAPTPEARVAPPGQLLRAACPTASTTCSSRSSGCCRRSS